MLNEKKICFYHTLTLECNHLNVCLLAEFYVDGHKRSLGASHHMEQLGEAQIKRAKEGSLFSRSQAVKWEFENSDMSLSVLPFHMTFLCKSKSFSPT